MHRRSALLLRRLDRLAPARRVPIAISSCYLMRSAGTCGCRSWRTGRATTAASKAAVRGAAEMQYSQFARHASTRLKQGHRFVNDVPVEGSVRGDDVK
jgi:hypothetical protein